MKSAQDWAMSPWGFFKKDLPWSTTYQDLIVAIQTDAQADLLDRLAKAEELLGFIADYPGWDIVVIQDRARAFLADCLLTPSAAPSLSATPKE